VLDVDGRDDVDTGGQQLFDVLPPLLVAGAGCVGVGELVDERDLRMPIEQAVEVEFVELDLAVAQTPASERGQAFRARRGRRTAVGLDDAHDDVTTVGEQAMALGQHLVRLADAGRGSEQHPQTAALHAFTLVLPSPRRPGCPANAPSAARRRIRRAACRRVDLAVGVRSAARTGLPP
jgi:hypothetical protein